MTVLMKLKSRINGKNADVTIYPDRIEWSKSGMMGGSKGTEVIPVKSISSVSTAKDGIGFTKVSAICTGNTIDFRLSHADASKARSLLQELILGNHPSQQQAAPPPPSYAYNPPPPVAAAPPPPPPIASAPPPPPSDLVAKLRELAELRDAGVLDDAEFAAAKAQVLGQA